MEEKKESCTRSAYFTFSEYVIPIGEVLEYYTDSMITGVVVDDRSIEYKDEIMSYTCVAKIITGKTLGIA